MENFTVGNKQDRYLKLRENIKKLQKEINEKYADGGKVSVEDIGEYQDNIDATNVLLDAINENEDWDVAQEEFDKLDTLEAIKKAINAIISDGTIIREWESESFEYATMVLDAISIM